ncbi:uncharacterized protein LACBIDRAFT_317434, partial [Laccaria bicolor S238N-H82]
RLFLELSSKSRLSSPSALKLAEGALPTASSKPLIINRLPQSTIQHPHFSKLSSSPSSTRDGSSPRYTPSSTSIPQTHVKLHISSLSSV